MPFKSEAQRRYLWMKHPDIAKRWAKVTPKDEKLPYHVKKKEEKEANVSVSKSNDNAINTSDTTSVSTEKVASITPEQAFKAGFLMRCIEERLNEDQINHRIKMAMAIKEAWLPGMDAVKSVGSGLSGLLGIIGAAGIGIPMAAGAVGGLSAAKLKPEESDPIEQAKHDELVNSYHFLADEAERRGKDKRKELGLDDTKPVLKVVDDEDKDDNDDGLLS